MIIYLLVTGAFTEFINYAVLGISTFSNKISYSGLLQNDKIEIRILSILMPLSIAIMAITLIVTNMLKNKALNKDTSINDKKEISNKKTLTKEKNETSIKEENEKIQNILTILIYSLSIIIVMYPISDEIHFLIGGLIAIIGLIYMIYLLGKKLYDKIKYDKKFKVYKIITLIIWILIFAIILTVAINNIYKYAKTEKNTEISHYKNIEVSEYLSNRINELDTYILQKEQESKKVYILDAEAAIYMIPIDKYNKDYDMFLKGNIGKDGEQGQIEKIEQRDENSLYLIKKENLKLNWQTPTNVLEYIRGNLELVEELNIYEVYR